MGPELDRECYSLPVPIGSTSSLPGKPKQRIEPVYCLGKNDSNGLGLHSVFPPPTYTRPRDSDGPAKTGPRSISLRTAPVVASRAISLPLPTAVKYATPFPTAIPEPTMSPTSRYIGFPGVPPISAILGRSCRQRSVARSIDIAVTRPPVGTCPAARGPACVASRNASMPLVNTVRPSVAHPDCSPPIGLGSASTRGSCSAGGCVGGPL